MASSPSTSADFGGKTWCWYGLQRHQAHPTVHPLLGNNDKLVIESCATLTMLCAQTNKHGQKLQCSHYKSRGPAEKRCAAFMALPCSTYHFVHDFDSACRPYDWLHRRPCVIYAHCNSGSRRDAEEALYVLLPHNITIFCLDFAVRPCCCMSKYVNGACAATLPGRMRMQAAGT